jgi:hypothetical protein
MAPLLETTATKTEKTEKTKPGVDKKMAPAMKGKATPAFCWPQKWKLSIKVCLF